MYWKNEWRYAIISKWQDIVQNRGGGVHHNDDKSNIPGPSPPPSPGCQNQTRSKQKEAATFHSACPISHPIIFKSKDFFLNATKKTLIGSLLNI